MRTTITISDRLHAALKHRAIDSGVTISDIVADAIKYQLLEDLEDIEDAENKISEPSIDFNQLVEDLHKEGLI